MLNEHSSPATNLDRMFNIQSKNLSSLASKPVLSLVALIAIERLIVYFYPTPTGWLKYVHTTAVILSLLIILGLILKQCAQLITSLRRVLPGYLHLLKSRLGIKSPQAPEAYMRELFDDYAETFDSHLIFELNYQTPSQLKSILFPVVDPDQRYNLLDLGCGTGLCAPYFKAVANELIGLDISSEMIAKANDTGLYDHLICDALSNLNNHHQNHFDIILAADVLVYFGELDLVFKPVANALKPEGYFAFSVEICKNQHWTVNPSGRYAHSRSYVTEVAQSLGFTLINVETHTLRTHRGEPVNGDIYLLQKA